MILGEKRSFFIQIHIILSYIQRTPVKSNSIQLP